MQINTIKNSSQFLGKNSSKEMNANDSKTFESVMSSLLGESQESEEDSLLQSQQMLGQLNLNMHQDLVPDALLSGEHQQVNQDELLSATHLLGQMNITYANQNQESLRQVSALDQGLKFNQEVIGQGTDLNQEMLQQSSGVNQVTNEVDIEEESLIDSTLVKENPMLKHSDFASVISKNKILKPSTFETTEVLDVMNPIDDELSTGNSLDESRFNFLSDVEPNENEMVLLNQDDSDLEKLDTSAKRVDELILTDMNFSNEIKQQDVSLRPISTQVASTATKWENQTQVMEVIKHQISMLKEQDSTTLTLKLYPEYLGNISVEMKMKNGVINANVLLENVEMKSVIEQELHQINLDGVSIEQLNVEVNAGTHQQGHFQNQKSNRTSSNQKDEFVEDELAYAMDDSQEIGRLNLTV